MDDPSRNIEQSLSDLQRSIENSFSLFSSNSNHLNNQAIDSLLSNIHDWADIHLLSPGNETLTTYFETAFRSILQRMIEDDQARDRMFALLRFVMTAAAKRENAYASAIVKIPLILLEEIFTSVTISRAEKLWDDLESLTNDHTWPDLFKRAPLIVLRLCNSLLRKLSKTYNTEFCGRILMFLAAVYPLSEKSALNIPGNINVNNKTIYDTEEAFVAALEEENRNLAPIKSEDDRMTNDDAGVDNMKEYRLQSSYDDAELSKRKSFLGESCDYDLYKVFWGLQNYFSSETKAMDDATVWASIVQSLDKIFGLLLSIPVETADSSSKEAHETSTYFGCKYLTSAKLIGLQVKDPVLRQQIACQVLFFVHFLRHRPPAFVRDLPPAVSVVTLTGKAGKDSKQSQSDAKSAANSKQNITTSNQQNSSNPPPPPLSINSNQEKFNLEVKNIEEKAFRILKSTPEGDALEDIVKRLLYREARYLRWKGKGCLPYERKPTDNDISDANSMRSYHSSWKLAPGERCNIPRYLGGKADEFKQVLNDNPREYKFDCDLETAKEYARLLAEDTSKFHKFVQDYLDAEDPEQCLEDEYHPKHDSLYCWRLRRLMSREKLSVFESMMDGNVAKTLNLDRDRSSASESPSREKSDEEVKEVEGFKYSEDPVADIGSENNVESPDLSPTKKLRVS